LLPQNLVLLANDFITLRWCLGLRRSKRHASKEQPPSPYAATNKISTRGRVNPIKLADWLFGLPTTFNGV